VAPGVAGSIPVTHPNYFWFLATEHGFAASA
jgi:hypothetical protein